MIKIKIISNPYLRKTIYERWDEIENEWIIVNRSNSPNSNLLNVEFSTSFFPFKAKEIVDVIIKEFENGKETIHIIFEGTDDDYRELLRVCKNYIYENKIQLEKSDRYLENAKDILPKIVAIFEDFKMLISRGISDPGKLKDDLEKFADASNKIIPICVLGNYSAGKSTFINALIGSEILPTADRPTTAKIYRISDSTHPEQASIKYGIDSDIVLIRFRNSDFGFSYSGKTHPINEKIKEELKLLKDKSIDEKLNRTLEILNTYENDSFDDQLSDIIEIETNFREGPLKNKDNPFVIFDTPGSNSETNYRHSEVLEKAMESLSNGIPIYVSEYTTLDSHDNGSFCNVIKNMEELDNRFTLIVVNKADSARLPKIGFSDYERDNLLNQYTVKKLYTEGVYFVSSILGLGAKNKGNFLDDHYREIFYEKKEKYEDPDNYDYKSLYNYNVMPFQIKEKAVEESLQCEDPILANSGLYCLEKDIETFAIKYAPYNKCHQSELFLKNAIAITEEDIRLTKEKREETKRAREEKFDKDKTALIEELEAACYNMKLEYSVKYSEIMKEAIEEAVAKSIKDDTKEQESFIAKEKEIENEIDTKKSKARKALGDVGSRFKERAQNAVKDLDVDNVASIGKGFVNDIGDTINSFGVWFDAKKIADKETSEILLNKIIEEFTEKYKMTQVDIDAKSREFWIEISDEVRKEFIKTITGSEVLDSDMRKDLEDIIMTYNSIVLESHAEDIFIKDKFELGLKIGKIKIGESSKLNIGKLTKTFNKEINTEIKQYSDSVIANHGNSFDAWMNDLSTTILENITGYSPDLSAQSDLIKKDTEKIKELEQRQDKLRIYIEDINSMVDWKHFN